MGGVGYDIHIPLATYYEIEKLGTEALVDLFIHTHVREDAIELFGFWSEREKILFEKLIAVSGIGPRLARVILSGMAPDDLLTSLATGDTARLATIPGIGKKTAQRMIVDLKDRVQDLAAELPEVVPTAPLEEDLVQALVNLGYREGEAQRAVIQARSESPGAPSHELLRASLQKLSHV